MTVKGNMPTLCKQLKKLLWARVPSAGGVSRSAAIRQAVLETASRRERAAQMRREVLSMDLGQQDGINVGDELARDRSGER